MTRAILTVATICLLAPFAAAAAAAAADGRITVLVLPFESATADKQWVGKAAQQTLVAELSNLANVSAASSSKPATSPDDAASAARSAGAQYAIFGGVQAANDELRVTGVVVETANSQPIGVLRATGPARDVFALQDQIADQAKAALPGVIAAPPPATTASAANTQPATTATAPAGYATRIDRGVARIDQANDRVAQLEDEIDRLRRRLRDLEDQDISPPPYRPAAYYDDYYEPYPYFGNYLYTPSIFFFKTYNRPFHCPTTTHHMGSSNLTVRGGFRSGNVAGGFRAGGGMRAGGGAVRAGGGGAVMAGGRR
jgi:TolB-like protein